MKSVKDKILTLLIVIFAGVFCFSGYMVITTIQTGKKEQQAFDNLASRVVTQAAEEAMDEIVTDEEVLAGYQALYEENNHLFGWVMIEGTELNYPVMFTPQSPEYYLRKAFDKSYAESGTPFLDAKCSEEGQHYILYGHNMRNGTMFNTATLYKDKSFWEKHPIIQFDTLKQRHQYQVIAAFSTDISLDHFQYYAYTDLSNPEVFTEFMTQLHAVALYDTGFSAEPGDVLLTLSTCSYHVDDGRFVVVAKRIVETDHAE